MPNITFTQPFAFVPSGASWLDIFRVPANFREVSLTADTWVVEGTAASGYPGFQVAFTGSFQRASAQALPTGTIQPTITLYDQRHVQQLIVDVVGRYTDLTTFRADPTGFFSNADRDYGIQVSGGSDVYVGGAGVDNFLIYGGGTHDLSGGAGANTIRFLNEAGISIDLSRTDFQSYGAGMIRLAGVNSVSGTAQGDVINGSAGNDIINSLGGADRISGGAGNDLIRVQDQSFPSVISTGGSVVHGNGGDDTLSFERGIANNGDMLYGDDGDDTIDALGGAYLFGGAGNDKLTTYLGSHAFGDEGTDAVQLNVSSAGYPAATELDGGAGDDSLYLFDYRSLSVGTAPINIVLNQPTPSDAQAIYASNFERIEMSGLFNVTGSAADEIFVRVLGGPSASWYPRGLQTIDGSGGSDVLQFSYDGDFARADRVLKLDGGSYQIDFDRSNRPTIFSNIETLKFNDGTVQIEDGQPLVDDLFYDFKYKDVYRSGADPDVHYHDNGWREGRDPNAIFSTNAYLAANPDLAAARTDPLEHYDLYGWREGRDPAASFDTALYLLHNPDVAAAKIDPLAHYLEYGMAEGRTAYAAIGTAIRSNGFDDQYYRLANPDVAAANVDPYQHYSTYGFQEGRNPNAFFDTRGFVAAYGQQIAASGLDPLDYYDQFGWELHQDPSVRFDTSSYEASYSDVAAAGINPLYHYLQFGAFEMRDTWADGRFD